jgi:selenium metabolism protein YedF
MSVKVDVRGLACPQPVIATKKALDSMEQGVIFTIVDNEVAKENVVKFAVANGCGVSVTEEQGEFSIRITKGVAKEEDLGLTKQEKNDLVYVLTQDTLGHGKKELGEVLIKSFFYTVLENRPLPKAIYFINSGVMLALSDSAVLEYLLGLAAEGVELLSCGTCLDFYKVKDKLAVGTVTNMYAIVDAMTKSGRVVTL